MHSEPQKEHQWLEKLVGEWSYEHECPMGPDQPLQKFTGRESVRLLGGLWAVGEGTGDMPEGGTATTIITIGYDPARQRYIGTFIASMMAHMWVYEGELDATGNVLTLNTEGPGFTPEGKPLGKMMKYKDVIEFKSADHRMLTSSTLGEDGQWHIFMSANYHRLK